MADQASADPWIGKYVVVRTSAAGVHAGKLVSHSDRQCELTESRRLWRWHALKGVDLSGVAAHGIDHAGSKIGATVDIILTENCEIIACSEAAAETIAAAPTYEPR